jgi:translation initiation factor IF-2
MAEEKLIRLSQAARKLNVGHNTILEFLGKKGFEVENNPNAKLTPEQFAMLSKEFASSATDKLEASGLSIGVKHADNVILENEKEVAAKKRIDEEERIMIKNLGSKDLKGRDESKEKVERDKPKLEGIKVVGKIDLEKKPVAKVEAPVEIEKTKAIVEEKPEVKPVEKKEAEIPAIEKAEQKIEPIVEKTKVEPPVVTKEPVAAPPEQELIKARADKLKGLKVVDKIELPVEKKKDAPVASSDLQKDNKGKRPRKRIPSPNEQQGPRTGQNQPGQRPQQHGQQHRPNQGAVAAACAKRRAFRKRNSRSNPRYSC